MDKDISVESKIFIVFHPKLNDHAATEDQNDASGLKNVIMNSACISWKTPSSSVLWEVYDKRHYNPAAVDNVVGHFSNKT